MVRWLTAFLVSIVLAPVAFAGAWGVGAFENDDALDWVSELTEKSDTALVYKTLEAARSQTYVDAPTGSSAVAAAEVVAAMLGHPAATLPPELTAWLERQHARPSGNQAALAKAALTRVLDDKTSELSQLWEDGDSKKWRATVELLRKRLDMKK